MSEEINRGFADFKLTWKENGVKREAHLAGNFSETEIVRTFCMLVNVNGLPDSSQKERNPDSAESCMNCKYYIPGNKEYYSCTKYGNFKFAKSTIIPCYKYDKKEKLNEP